MSGTWILFTSGQAVEIIVNRTVPAKVGGNPADVYVVAHPCHQSFQESAQRAAALCYYWAETHGLNPQPYVAGIDLAGIEKGDSLTGESGGVAFAVALAKMMFAEDPGPVAATGIVTPKDGGQIEAIRGLSSKLDAAAENLPAGSWVFYPKANLEPADDPAVIEIQEKIIQLQNKGYKLHAVSTLDEVLLRLFPSKTVAVKQKQSFRVGWVLLALVVLLGLYMVLQTGGSITDRSVGKMSESVAESGGKQTVPLSIQPQVDSVPPVVEPSAPSESSHIAAESPTEEIKNQVGIEGNGRLATELANMVTKLLLAQPNLSLEPPAAKLQISGLTEEMQSKGMLSSLSFEVSALKLQSQNKAVTLPACSVTLEESGAIEEALPGIAQQFMECLLKMIPSQNRDSATDIDGKDHGQKSQKKGFE